MDMSILVLFLFCVYNVLSLSASNNGLGSKECLAYQMVGISYMYTHVYVYVCSKPISNCPALD